MNDRPRDFAEAIESAQAQIDAAMERCVALERENAAKDRRLRAYERYVRMLKRPKREPELPAETAALIARQEDE